MKAAFPKTIKVGSASVKVFEVRSKTTTVYSVDWRSQGRRRRKAFKAPVKALKFAKEQAQALHGGRLTCADFSPEDREALHRTRSILQPLSVSLEHAVNEYAGAIHMLGETSLKEAVQFYLRHAQQQSEDVSIREAINQFLEALAKENRSQSHLHVLKVRLTRFNERFAGSMSSITGRAVEDWLDGLTSKAGNIGSKPLPIGARTRRNYFDAVRSLVTFSKRRGNASLP